MCEVGPGVVADIFHEADVDGDGKVSCEEFAGIFYGRNRPAPRGGAGAGSGGAAVSGGGASHVSLAHASCSG